MSAPSRRQVPLAGFDGFISTVLAPIPATEEQADTPAFRSLIAADKARAWNTGIKEFRRINAGHKAECENGHFRSRAAEVLFFCLQVAAIRQIQIPAPTEKELRWKSRQAKWLPSFPEIQRAIAADERRFGLAGVRS